VSVVCGATAGAADSKISNLTYLLADTGVAVRYDGVRVRDVGEAMIFFLSQNGAIMLITKQTPCNE